MRRAAAALAAVCAISVCVPSGNAAEAGDAGQIEIMSENLKKEGETAMSVYDFFAFLVLLVALIVSLKA